MPIPKEARVYGDGLYTLNRDSEILSWSAARRLRHSPRSNRNDGGRGLVAVQCSPLCVPDFFESGPANIYEYRDGQHTLGNPCRACGNIIEEA